MNIRGFIYLYVFTTNTEICWLSGAQRSVGGASVARATGAEPAERQSPAGAEPKDSAGGLMFGVSDFPQTRKRDRKRNHNRPKIFTLLKTRIDKKCFDDLQTMYTNREVFVPTLHPSVRSSVCTNITFRWAPCFACFVIYTLIFFMCTKCMS